MKTMVKIWVSCVMLFFSFSSSAQDEVARWACAEDHEKARAKLSQLAVEKGVNCGYLEWPLHELEPLTGMHICEAKSKEEIFTMTSGTELVSAPDDDKCIIYVFVVGSLGSMAALPLTMEDVLNTDIYPHNPSTHYFERTSNYYFENTPGYSVEENITSYVAVFHPKLQQELEEEIAIEIEEDKIYLAFDIASMWSAINFSWQEDKELFWSKYEGVKVTRPSE